MNLNDASVYTEKFYLETHTAESHNMSIYFTGIQLSRLRETKEGSNVNHAL